MPTPKRTWSGRRRGEAVLGAASNRGAKRQELAGDIAAPPALPRSGPLAGSCGLAAGESTGQAAPEPTGLPAQRSCKRASWAGSLPPAVCPSIPLIVQTAAAVSQ